MVQYRWSKFPTALRSCSQAILTFLSHVGSPYRGSYLFLPFMTSSQPRLKPNTAISPPKNASDTISSNPLTLTHANCWAGNAKIPRYLLQRTTNGTTRVYCAVFERCREPGRAKTYLVGDSRPARTRGFVIGGNGGVCGAAERGSHAITHSPTCSVVRYVECVLVQYGRCQGEWGGIGVFDGCLLSSCRFWPVCGWRVWGVLWRCKLFWHGTVGTTDIL
ncbi:hypothetical protein HOY80DRAFT_300965 [Tuber brumale]|nr:hypothetical protein HOY80DRAFT_300965 [Tuber brumale]